MDLDALGTHCALASCNERDFLPIQCDCLQSFCRFHISQDSHNCKASRNLTVTPQSSSTGRPRCTLPGCNKPLLTSGPGGASNEQTSAAGCPACGLSFCVYHRHQQSHTCSGLSRQVNGMNCASTRSPPILLKGMFKNSTNRTKSAQLQKVNAMKMRLRSIPADPKDNSSLIPVDQRIHVHVYYEVDGSSHPPKEGIFWFQKSVATGRALDLLANRFDIPSSKASSLTLYRTDDSSELQSHLPLSAHVIDTSSLTLRHSSST
ncbi:hypothetical protein EDC04DRAFT_2688302, partial [Pisolithus marmoratus]